MVYIMEAADKSKGAAKQQILNELGIKESDVDFEVVGEGSSKVGRIFNFGKNSGEVIVRAYANNKTANLSTEVIGSGIALTLIRKMGYEASVTETQDVEGKAYIRLDSPKSGALIGKRGKNLEAIQFITDLIASRVQPEKKKIILDIGEYRSKRQDALEKLAMGLSKKVVESGRSKLLEPMNPFERRIIHLTLQEHQSVFTKSEGSGVYKKVRIALLPDGMSKEQFMQREAEREMAAGDT